MSTETVLTRRQIEEVLLDVLREVQELMGESAAQVKEETRPIGDLMGFDSLCAVSVTTDLAERLSLEDIDSKLFWSQQTGKPLTFGEIVNRLCRMLKITGE